jgi:ATP-dependent protease Clp ATPase subunit
MSNPDCPSRTAADTASPGRSSVPIDRKTGARGLRSIMEAILLDTMFDLL